MNARRAMHLEQLLAKMIALALSKNPGAVQRAWTRAVRDPRTALAALELAARLNGELGAKGIRVYVHVERGQTSARANPGPGSQRSPSPRRRPHLRVVGARVAV